MEFVSGGELLTYITYSSKQKTRKKRAFSENNIRFYAAELIIALKQIHELGIIYRDLKPENILIDSDGHLKLSDFGLSKYCDALTFTLCGTPEYVAPEVLMNKGYSKNIDWWSFGMLLYEMYTGETLFKNCKMTEIVKILKGVDEVQITMANKSSPEFYDLLSATLKKDPHCRLGSANDASDLMSHPFFAHIDWEQVEGRTMAPPFVPKLQSQDDTSMFSPALVSQSYDECYSSKSNSCYETGVNFDAFEYDRQKEDFTDYCAEFGKK